MGVRLAGDLPGEMDEHGEPIRADTLLLLLNAHWEQVPFKLPATKFGDIWEALIDTNEAESISHVVKGEAEYPLFGRSLALLRLIPTEQAGTGVTPISEQLARKDRRGRRQPTHGQQPLSPQ